MFGKNREKATHWNDWQSYQISLIFQWKTSSSVKIFALYCLISGYSGIIFYGR